MQLFYILLKLIPNFVGGNGENGLRKNIFAKVIIETRLLNVISLILCAAYQRRKWLYIENVFLLFVKES